MLRSEVWFSPAESHITWTTCPKIAKNDIIALGEYKISREIWLLLYYQNTPFDSLYFIDNRENTFLPCLSSSPTSTRPRAIRTSGLTSSRGRRSASLLPMSTYVFSSLASPRQRNMAFANALRLDFCEEGTSPVSPNSETRWCDNDGLPARQVCLSLGYFIPGWGDRGLTGYYNNRLNIHVSDEGIVHDVNFA